MSGFRHLCLLLAISIAAGCAVDVVSPPPPGVVEYWQTTDGRWYWHRKAGNGEIVFQGEGYKNRVDLLHTVDKFCPGVPVKKVETYREGDVK